MTKLENGLPEWKVKNSTRLDLIFERTYVNFINLFQCKICFKVFTENGECVMHQVQEHTDKQFEDRF